jgi:hypothetical protein
MSCIINKKTTHVEYPIAMIGEIFTPKAIETFVH